MADLFASGRLVDFILVVVVLEAAALLLYWRYARRGIAPLDLLPNLCAGAFLLLALRITLGGGGWMIGLRLPCGRRGGASDRCQPAMARVTPAERVAPIPRNYFLSENLLM